MNAKCLSSLLKVRMFYVATVLRQLIHEEILEEILVEVLAEEITSIETTETDLNEKCTRQLALDVRTSAKYHSNLLKVEMYFVATVLRKTEIKENP
jgi:hypothetical protein